MLEGGYFARLIGLIPTPTGKSPEEQRDLFGERGGGLERLGRRPAKLARRAVKKKRVGRGKEEMGYDTARSVLMVVMRVGRRWWWRGSARSVGLLPVMRGR